MNSREGGPDPAESTFPEEWAQPGVLHGQAYALGIDGQPLDTASEINPHSAALIRQADAIAAEYEGASL